LRSEGSDERQAVGMTKCVKIRVKDDKIDMLFELINKIEQFVIARDGRCGG
jgi:hypothetical protein